MKPRALPDYEVGSCSLPRSLIRTHFIRVDGRVIHSQLSPYSQAEIVERLRSYVDPPPVAPVKPIPVTQGRGRKASSGATRGGIDKEFDL